MAAKALPAQEVLLQLLSYDPLTGKLFWKERGPQWFKAERDRRIWNSRFAGTVAGNVSKRGYVSLHIFGGDYLAHRVIWKMMTGHDPEVTDHEDGDKGNNRWCNLRSVTPSMNNQNQPVPCDNASGVIGVYWVKRRSKWAAQIKADGRNRYLGEFLAFDDAVAARKIAEQEHGFHANHGRAA